MSVELVLAAVSAADLCLKYGKKLIGVYRDVQEADEAVRSKLLIVEATWSKTEMQLEFVKKVAHVLQEDHCRIHLQVLDVLNSKLTLAISRIESVLKCGSELGVKRWKYARLRESIDESIAQLQHWQSIFDPTWVLILRMNNRLIDEELSEPLRYPSTGDTFSETTVVCAESNVCLTSALSIRSVVKGGGDAPVHVTLAESGLDWNSTEAIEYSSTVMVHRKGSEKIYAVDTIACDATYDLQRLREDTESLAKKLKRDDIGSFGLLPCKGVIKKKSHITKSLASMSLAFQLPYSPKGNCPVSLRYYLLQSRKFDLNGVVDIAKQLATAVSSIHTLDFVHKNIRPETILIFPDDGVDSPCELGSAYLLGFDSFRNVNFHTIKVGDDAWERNLYRHPTRQGIQAQEKYIMQHDVYSLGVCLLELGLWESFVEYQAELGEIKGTKVPGLGLGLNVCDFVFQPGNVVQTLKIKERLVSLAKFRLPLSMGKKYAAVVNTCLTCLDEDNHEFGEEEMADEDGIVVGVRFIEKVLVKLGDIAL